MPSSFQLCNDDLSRSEPFLTSSPQGCPGQGRSKIKGETQTGLTVHQGTNYNIRGKKKKKKACDDFY